MSATDLTSRRNQKGKQRRRSNTDRTPQKQQAFPAQSEQDKDHREQRTHQHPSTSVYQARKDSAVLTCDDKASDGAEDISTSVVPRSFQDIATLNICSPEFSHRRTDFLYHFAKITGPRGSLDPARDAHTQIWMPIVLVDELAFYVILMLSASHRAVLENTSASITGDPRVITSNRTMADMAVFIQKSVKLLNEALRNQKTATSDETIGLLALFVGAGLFADIKVPFASHLAGLKRMVALRGGLIALPVGLAGIVGACSTKVAVMTNTQPIFSTLPAPTLHLEPSKLVPAPVFVLYMDLASSFFKRSNQRLLHKRLLVAVQDLRDITIMTSVVRKDGVKLPIDVVRYFEYVYVPTEHSLASLPYDCSEYSRDKTPLQEALRVALLIYSSTTLVWTMDRSGMLVKSLTAQLDGILASIDMSAVMETSPELLIWIVVQGVHSSLPPQQEPLLCHIAQCVRGSTCEAEEEVRVIDEALAIS